MMFVPYVPDQKPPASSLSRRDVPSGLVSDPHSSANIMPTYDAQLDARIKANPVSKILPETGRYAMSNIYAPRSAPSSISSEAFLKSRANFSPEFIHNEAATRIARTSNFYADSPRFRSDLDILA